jgi:hypothetical protein
LLRERLRTGNPKMDAERNSVMLDFCENAFFAINGFIAAAKVVLGNRKSVY